MNRTALRIAAAVLSAGITVGGLKWIAVLATVDTRPLPVAVMPQVVVTATALDATTRFADVASQDSGPN